MSTSIPQCISHQRVLWMNKSGGHNCVPTVSCIGFTQSDLAAWISIELSEL